MSLIIKYAKKDYLAKITELEGYHKQLTEHLAKMQDLKGDIGKFWESEGASTTAELLAIQIRATERTMAQVEDNLTFYRTIIDKLDGADLNASEMLRDALAVVSGV